MVLHHKSPSSIQEAPVGNGERKAGLKRKLTGPPRLLLGKSKAKSDLEGREDNPRMHAEGLDSYGNHWGTMVTQQSTIHEERTPMCISENQEKPVGSEVKQMIPENQFETEGWYCGNQSEDKSERSDTRNDPKEKSGKMVWKRIFSSLNCIRKRRKRLSKMSAMEDVTFHNTHSAKFECDTGLGMSDTLPPEQQQNAQMNNHPGCRSVKRRAPFPVRMRWNITKLLNAPSHHKKAKRQSEAETHFGYVDSLGPDLHLRKRIGHFLKHGLKKPSPFFHEQLEGNSEYLDEETIVLSNRHAGDAFQGTPTDIQEGNHSDGDIEVTGSQSLTVSVEVSVTGEVDRDEMQTNTASGNLIIANGQRETTDPQALVEASDENGIMADITESSRHPELVMAGLLVKETPSTNFAVQGAPASWLYTVGIEEGQEGILEGQDIRLPVDDTCISLCESFKETVACDEKSVEETIPLSRVTDEDSMQDNLALKSVNFDDLHSYYDDTNRDVENGPEVSSELNLWKKDNGYKHSLDVKVLDSQCSDVLLVQTACSLVQAAMKAALDQLTKELKNKTVRIHTQYHEFQDDNTMTVVKDCVSSV